MMSARETKRTIIYDAINEISLSLLMISYILATQFTGIIWCIVPTGVDKIELPRSCTYQNGSP